MKPVAPIALAALLAACAPSEAPPLQGYVEGEFVRVAAPFAGTLLQLEVARGHAVQSGAALFALEAESEGAGQREASERVRRAEAQLEDLRKGRRESEVAAVRAQLAQAEAVAAQSARDRARQDDLVAKGFVSRQRADEARAAHERDRARVAEMQAQLATMRAGARPDELRAAEAEVAAAREALAQAQWRLKRKSVASEVAGVVTDTLFARGEWVPAGVPVVTVLPAENRKVRFFVPEPALSGVRLGQRVRVACDGCAADLAATVSFIAPQAEFTPPVIYSKERRARLVFLVEAKPDAGQAGSLHPGQPVDVRLQ